MKPEEIIQEINKVLINGHKWCYPNDATGVLYDYEDLYNENSPFKAGYMFKEFKAVSQEDYLYPFKEYPKKGQSYYLPYIFDEAKFIRRTWTGNALEKYDVDIGAAFVSIKGAVAAADRMLKALEI
jgi:hypothetical protein